jgi:hypothetical protein
MRDALAKGLGAAKLGIHVMRKEVAGMACMHDDISLGDCPAKGAAAFADGVILKILWVFHERPLWLNFAYENIFDK